MKYLIILITLLFSIQILNGEADENRTIRNSMAYKYDRNRVEFRLRQHASEAYPYLRWYGMDTEYIFLVDFSIPSGYDRLFLYEYDRDTILFECMVAHGQGLQDSIETWDGIPSIFSNTHESHNSSLGKYMIGKRGKSVWGVGTKYELYGLDTSNSNAHERDIVLHSWSAIPNREIYPRPLAKSWGCPAVSDSCFQIIDGVIYYRGNSMMLYIYN